MTIPDHLFVSSTDGHLYDTRDPDWSHHPLRMNYRLSHREIQTAADLKACLRAGEYTDVGGYPLFFVTANGDALSFASVRANLRDVLGAIVHPSRFEDEWRVIAMSVNYEDGDLYCAHSEQRIPSAYAEPDDGPDLRKAELFADANRGVYIPQHFAQAVTRELVTGVSDEDYATLTRGPDDEWYWETWERVLDHARLAHPTLGECYLHQDGDLWIVPK